MAIKLKRPILIGGLGLTAGVYLWDTITPSIADAGSFLLWGTVAAGSAAWWLGRRGKSLAAMPPTLHRDPLTQQQIHQAWDRVAAAIEQFRVEAATVNLPDDAIQTTVAQFTDTLHRIRQNLDRQRIQIVTLGDKGVGKTTLVQWLQQEFVPSIATDLDGWTVDVADNSPLQHLVPESYADLILYVVAGDLTESQFQQITALVQQGYRLSLVFAQTDRYLPNERSQILQKLTQQLAQVPSGAIHVVATAIAPAPIKVRKLSDDGTVAERFDTPSADVDGLSAFLKQQAIQDRRQLLWGTALRQTDALQAQVQDRLNQMRRDRAMPIIEDYQWIAAAAAFANPVPSLDLLATAAITTQMVVDVGALYNVNFSIDQAKKTASALAELMVKLGLVELASQALSPLLKSNLLTFAAGGLLQGLSAAYLTHVAGMSLIQFFEDQAAMAASQGSPTLSMDALKRHLQVVFTQNQRIDFLKALVQKGTSRLLKPSGAALAG